MKEAAQWIQCKQSFYADIANRYRQNCKRHGVEPTFEGFAEYLNKSGLVYDSDIGLYMVKVKYPEALYKNNCRKRQAVYALEETIPLNERAIWRAIASERTFSPDRNAGKAVKKNKDTE